MEKIKKAFTVLFVLVLMLANLPAFVSALEETQDISDMLSAKAELQSQKDGNWTALKDQAEVEPEAALKLKIDYTIPAEQLKKALDQASQLEATITLPDGADFVMKQTANHGNVTVLDKKDVIGTYHVATESSGAQVLKLALNGEEVQKAGSKELSTSTTLNATLKDPQEKQTLKFASKKMLFTNTSRPDIELKVLSAKEKTDEVRDPVILGDQDETDQNTQEAANSRIEGNPAKGTVLIQIKTLSDPIKDASAVNGINVNITGADGIMKTAATKDFTNAAGQVVQGVAEFQDLPSDKYTISGEAGGSDSLYIGDAVQNTYRKAAADDLILTVDRERDASGFSFVLFKPFDSVSIEKADPNQSQSINVQLMGHYQDGLAAGTAIGEKQTLEENDPKYTWSALPATVPEAEAGNGDLTSYSVKEDPVEGYTTSTADPVITPTYDHDENGKATDQVISNNYQYTVTNEASQETTSVRLVIKWEDNDDMNRYRPNPNTFQLFADGEIAKDKEGKPISAVTLGSDRDLYTFKELPKYRPDGKTEIKYSAKLTKWDKPGRYVSESGDISDDGVITITNTIWFDTIHVYGEVHWEDISESMIPKEITLGLYANGELVKQTQVSKETEWGEEGDWIYVFESDDPPYDPLKYDAAGKEIEYQVKKIGGEDFSTRYTRSIYYVYNHDERDFNGCKIRFYDGEGNSVADIPLVNKIIPGNGPPGTWEAYLGGSEGSEDKDYRGYTARFIDKDGTVRDYVPLDLKINIINTPNNTPKIPLPMTGGSGSREIVLIGLGALSVSLLSIYWRKRNQKGAA
ncbi:Cna B-type domain-containing protein [Enterococcus hirae]|nr:Cna B-type domain-containing protein [Enterococcus hirae]